MMLFSLFKLSADRLFCFISGYASLSLIEEEIVTRHMWLIPSEYGDIISISEMTPGPLAINAATFVGNRVMGPLGSIVATLGLCFRHLSSSFFSHSSITGIRA